MSEYVIIITSLAKKVEEQERRKEESIMNTYNAPHRVSQESLYFEEFIKDALIEMGCRVHPVYPDNEGLFYLLNGLTEYTTDNAYAKVDYSNNIDACFFSLKQYIQYIDHGSRLFIISLVDDEVAKKHSSGKVTVLGKGFVRRLIQQSPKLWWNFIAACSKSIELQIDEEENRVTIPFQPLGVIETGLSAYLSLEKIGELSTLNEESFKRELENRIKQDNDYPVSVIIGNGVSIPFGSDSWTNLSDYLFDYLTPKYVDNPDRVRATIGNSHFSNTLITKRLIDPKKYYEALYSCVYRKYEKSMHRQGTIVNAIVKSKKRYPSLNLVTYNYDEFIEEEYKKETGKTLSSVAGPKKDAMTAEPKIKHVHGLLPYKSPSTHTNIVLTQEEYFETYNLKKNSWTVLTQKDALQGLCLFVGSSMSDLFQMSLINEVKQSNYQNNSTRTVEKWFCLMCIKGLSPKDIATVYTYYLQKGIRLIMVEDFSELAKKYEDLFQ